MGATMGSATMYAKAYLPDRSNLVAWGLLSKLDDSAAKKDKAARKQRRLFRAMDPLIKSMKFSVLDLHAYFDAYSDCDVGGTQSVTYGSFCEYFHLIPCYFLEAMFFNFNKDKPMTFQHFVVATYYYCASDIKELTRHIFRVYDRRRQGKIHEMVVEQIIRDVYSKGFRLEPGATRAIVNLINCTGKEHRMVTEDQFVGIIWKQLDPARSIQSDLKKRIMDFIFWWRVNKNGAPTSTISFHSSWDQQVEIETALAEEDRIASHQAAYRAMGVAWQGDKPPPASFVEKERFDADGNDVIATDDASSTTDSVNGASSLLLSPSAVKFNTSPVKNRGRMLVQPKGRTLILAKAKRERKQLEAPTRNLLLPDHYASSLGVQSAMIIDTASPNKKVHCEDLELIRPERMAINSMRIPQTLGVHSFGKDGFAGSRSVITNFEKMTTGRDIGILISQLAD